MNTDEYARLILYYPVSALVTLFANILQNPQDSRARSDLKLMTHVVTFLSALCEGDENSSVRRMLSVCSEFERIAKIVLDKTEKESHSRRKRKQQEIKDDKVTQTGTPAAQGTASTPKPIQNPTTPQPSQPGNIPNVFTPPDYGKFATEEVGPRSHFVNPESKLISSLQGFQSLSGSLANDGTPSSDVVNGAATTSGTWLSPQAVSALSPSLNGSNRSSAAMDFSDAPPITGTSTSGLGTPGFAGGLDMTQMFQQPFVPQDLWQMPMTLDWDWDNLTAGYSGFEDPIAVNGLAANGVLNDLPATLPSRFDQQNGPVGP
jgi:hypothetical protein